MALSGCFGDDRKSSGSVEPTVPSPEVEPTVPSPEVEPTVPSPEVEPTVPSPEVESKDIFSVELNIPDSVTQNTVFTMAATPKENEGAVSYQWSLNNTVVSEDAIHHTMLPALGDHMLTIVATNAEGNEYTQSTTISVIAQPSLNPDFSFSINVSDKAGFSVQEVPVTINGTTVITDQYGLAQFDDISQTALMLVSASKEGYLTQTYQYSFDAAQENAMATLTLQNINPVSHIVDSSEAVDITETELHTKLTLAANSFVDAEGNAVTGEVDITITPIDIRAVDNAFLGGGQALTDSGETVALISTGMADYQFSQNGSEVSLAEGMSATIEMDLAATTGDDGRVFAEGDTIEMWWFDSETGFWIEDGVGTVQVSDTSETGLKLVATVNHFTTWNWDYYKQDDRSSITFKCLKNGLPLAADESCNITAESTSINRQFIASSEGITVLNTPPNVTYSVTANSGNGNPFWAGRITVTTVAGENTAIVNMQSAEVKIGYVQCRVINNAVTSIVPCNTVISAGSIADQNIDSTNSNNFRAAFPYVQGDELDITATIVGGLNQMIAVDTNIINGTLDIEFVFDIQHGSLQCSATLDGSDMQYFPCAALVTDDDESSFYIFDEDFSGTPLKALFTYPQDTQSLFFHIASIFDDARIDDLESDGVYFSGQGTEVAIDLTVDAATAHVTYEVQSKNVYRLECINEAGENVDCNIRLEGASETVIFEGSIDKLTNSEILPTWMNSKILVENPLEGSGYAEIFTSGQYLRADGYAVDAANGVITFTLVELPQ